MKNARQKKPRLIITFESDSNAMVMEAALDGFAGLGRIISVPQTVSAGCGLAWSALPEQRDELIGLMREKGVLYREITVIEMY